LRKDEPTMGGEFGKSVGTSSERKCFRGFNGMAGRNPIGARILNVRERMCGMHLEGKQRQYPRCKPTLHSRSGVTRAGVSYEKIQGEGERGMAERVILIIVPVW